MSSRENLLLVEGKDDLRVVPELVERAGVAWGRRDEEIVRICDINGFENLSTEFEPQLKSSGLRRVGIMVDANADPAARWRAIRTVTERHCQLPPSAPSSGFIAPTTRSGFRLGVWMMPDNGAAGMMETFLLGLRPDANPQLFQHVDDAVRKAREIGAPFGPRHLDKARIHTWLAWQDPPGRQLHQAIVEVMLDPRCIYAKPFLSWFTELYELSVQTVT